MNYLLDTHVLLWTLIDHDKLSKKVKAIILNLEDQKWVSAISFWEISLKYAAGKLDIKGALPEDLLENTIKVGFELINLVPETAVSFYKLPKLRNKDPFDRMLAWQAINENFTLLSKDKGFDDYKSQGLKRIW